jgi:hypothetical protein
MMMQQPIIAPELIPAVPEEELEREGDEHG